MCIQNILYLQLSIQKKQFNANLVHREKQQRVKHCVMWHSVTEIEYSQKTIKSC